MPPEIVVATLAGGEHPALVERAIDLALRRMDTLSLSVALCKAGEMHNVALTPQNVVMGPLDATKSNMVHGAIGHEIPWVAPVERGRWTLSVHALEVGARIGHILRGRALLLLGPEDNPVLDAIEEAHAACGMELCAGRRRLPVEGLQPAELVGDHEVVLVVLQSSRGLVPLLSALVDLPDERQRLVFFFNDLPGTTASSMLPEALADVPEAACRIWSLTPYADGLVEVDFELEASRSRDELARFYDGMLLTGLALAGRETRDAPGFNAAMARVLAAEGDAAPLALDDDGWAHALDLVRRGRSLPPLSGASAALPDPVNGSIPIDVLYAVRRGWAEGAGEPVWQVVERVPVWQSQMGLNEQLLEELIDADGCR